MVEKCRVSGVSITTGTGAVFSFRYGCNARALGLALNNRYSNSQGMDGMGIWARKHSYLERKDICENAVILNLIIP